MNKERDTNKNLHRFDRVHMGNHKRSYSNNEYMQTINALPSHRDNSLFPSLKQLKMSGDARHFNFGVRDSKIYDKLKQEKIDYRYQYDQLQSQRHSNLQAARIIGKRGRESSLEG